MAGDIVAGQHAARAQQERLEDVRRIREALLIGLECFGEVERVENVFDLHETVRKGSLPVELRPLHPTGTDDTVGRFAGALRILECLEAEALRAA